MSRTKVWLWGQKKLQNYLRALKRYLPPQCSNLSTFSSSSEINYSAYLSSYLQKNKFNKKDCSFFSGAPSSPKIPRHRRGIFSFSEEEKFIFVSEINKIPARYRAGLINLIEKHKSRVYFCPVFKPNNFNYDLAEKSDIYFIYKRSWLPVICEIKNALERLTLRGESLPEFIPRFTLREKLLVRLLFRFRKRFLKIEEISSYIYGRRLANNIHSSEAIVAGLRRKIEKITKNKPVLRSIRNYGYQLEDEIWERLV